MYRAYSGNGSDQGVLESCLEGLGELHDALDAGERRSRPASRTLVRDGGFWSPQLELNLDLVGYYSLISLPLSHAAGESALVFAARRGTMKKLSGDLADVRAARTRAAVGELDRTLVVVESEELCEGQKRGIAAVLIKATAELEKLARLVDARKIRRASLTHRAKKALRREHLSTFVIIDVGGTEASPTIARRVDEDRRRALEQTRLGRRVLCTDQHSWTTERIVHAFRGQWKVEELFRRAKKGGIAPWGPSFQHADGSLRLHTFATVIGLMLVSLVRIELDAGESFLKMMESLAGIRATLVRTTTGGMGRRPTVALAPELTTRQRRAVKVFELARWMPSLLSCMATRARPDEHS